MLARVGYGRNRNALNRRALVCGEAVELRILEGDAGLRPGLRAGSGNQREHQQWRPNHVWASGCAHSGDSGPLGGEPGVTRSTLGGPPDAPHHRVSRGLAVMERLGRVGTALSFEKPAQRADLELWSHPLGC